MNNLINLLLHNKQIQFQFDSLSQQLPKLPIELMEFVKVGDLAILEVISQQDGNLQGILKVDNQELVLALNNKLLNLSKGEHIEIPVKIGSDGKLLLQKPLTSSDNIKPSTDISIKNQNLSIELSSLKISNFIDSELQAMDVSKEIRQFITKDIPQLEVVVENLFENKNVDTVKLQNLQNIIKQIVSNTQPLSNLKSLLIQEVNHLVGQKVLGKITHSVNDITLIKTPLGETYYDTKLKLPISEPIVVAIKGISNDYSSEIKKLDEIFKNLFRTEKTVIKTEELSQYPQLKLLTKIADDIPKELFYKIIDKVTLNSQNLLKTLYNLYQIDSSDKTSKLVTQDLAPRLLQATPKGVQIIQDIQNIIINSIRDNPTWRIIEMPFFDGSQLQPFKFAIKKDNQKNNRSISKQKVGTRFIVETEFSKLGCFQFDGFSNISKRNFDLIIRTSKHFNEDFCSNIINLFKKSLYKLDYSGTIKINCQSDFIRIHEQNNINEGIYA